MKKEREELSELPYWEDFYEGRHFAGFLPNPNKYRGDWYFDKVFGEVFKNNIQQKILEVAACAAGDIHKHESPPYRLNISG